MKEGEGGRRALRLGVMLSSIALDVRRKSVEMLVFWVVV